MFMKIVTFDICHIISYTVSIKLKYRIIACFSLACNEQGLNNLLMFSDFQLLLQSKVFRSRFVILKFQSIWVEWTFSTLSLLSTLLNPTWVHWLRYSYMGNMRRYLQYSAIWYNLLSLETVLQKSNGPSQQHISFPNAAVESKLSHHPKLKHRNTHDPTKACLYEKFW